ncbi:UDP-N-acetylmuramoylalanine--D-glutamate ligase [Thiomicrorhabdus immobilis]|uniref:UDP-N-acetylmuramoylalanine--D-glutamate ligase n=1 Tax=Thiomicrorhabdus immobilis TaxID=2791037 RepID=A0ABM7MEU3_9GAMM|nr:UDP-N-acetylmuramoyl-L-alanine--D-glutamate ligase [Thiomicrorhabdus immobilis]BCN93870.1 UDP-N-acetylmuramoylalanine--D-glutamate ligase [Thiomicrorhabdus immobilis]
MYLVAGLGVTGQSVLRYFKAQGEPCLAFDTRADFDVTALQQEYPDVEFALGEVPLKWLKKFETIILSPGIAKSEPWVSALEKLGKQTIGDIELFARAVGAPVIAITGSNGKSTVTTITGLALAEAGYNVGVGGNIGEPALDLLLDDNEYDVYVLELSSFQLETTYSLTTASSTVLNVSEDHMDRYVGIEDYIQAKTKVFADTELAVIPFDLSEQGLIHHGDVVRFCASEGFVQSDKDYGIIEHNNQAWLGHGQNPQVPLESMRLKGLHHQLNALAMLALCRPFNVENRHFETVLSQFTGLPHRTELVVVHEDVTWINDSKGTNVGATQTALESIGKETLGKLILIAGGVGKDADFSGLKAPVEQFCKKVVLFGRDQDLIAEALQSNQSSAIDLSKVEDLATAVAIALENSQPQDCVLFSPACASFDQFANYVQRGEIFVELVHQACASFDAALIPKDDSTEQPGQVG